MSNYQSADEMSVVVEWNNTKKLWEAISVVDEEFIVTTNNNRNLCILEAQRKGYRVELKSRGQFHQSNSHSKDSKKPLGRMPRISDD